MFAMLSIKGCARKRKEISKKSLTPVGTLVPLVLHSHAFLTNFGSTCKTRTLRSLRSHALLILAKESQSKSQLVCQTKVKLSIPQLTLAKFVQSGRHESGSQEVPGSILTGGNFFAEFLFRP